MSDAPTVKYVFASVTSDGKPDVPALTITTINPDREGDRVIPEGGDFTDFLRNPVLMWAHGGRDGYASVPIGTVSSLEVMPGKGVKAAWKWLEGDPFADRIKNAWDQGVVRASSIGFKPVKVTPNGQGLDHEKWELLELSLCAIPMNPEAVRTIKGLLDFEPKADHVATKSMMACLEHLTLAIGMHEVHMAEPQSATPESQVAMMAHMVAAKEACMSSMGGMKAEMDAIQKRGRVLSSVNESRLRAAVTSLSDATTVLSEVLAQLESAQADVEAMPTDPEQCAVTIVEEPIVLRLLLADEDPVVLSLTESNEPVFSIDPDDLRRAISDVMREQLQAALVLPVTEHLARTIDLARGIVH